LPKRKNREKMNLSAAQFGYEPGHLPNAPKTLNKGVSKMYKQLSEQLSLEIKQAKLAKEICYPWELNCSSNPAARGLRNPYAL
jgi:hypothetical protein